MLTASFESLDIPKSTQITFFMKIPKHLKPSLKIIQDVKTKSSSKRSLRALFGGNKKQMNNNFLSDHLFETSNHNSGSRRVQLRVSWRQTLHIRGQTNQKTKMSHFLSGSICFAPGLNKGWKTSKTHRKTSKTVIQGRRHARSALDPPHRLRCLA